MTLTQMIQAHDGGTHLKPGLVFAIDAVIPQGHHMRGLIFMALRSDLNAAWRLLAPGWRWRMMDEEKSLWVVAAVRPKQAGRCVYPGTHKSLPCAMVLAALKTWGVE